jgi:hypothetical protein
VVPKVARALGGDGRADEDRRGDEGRPGSCEATVVRVKIGEGTKVGRGAARRRSCGMKVGMFW